MSSDTPSAAPQDSAPPPITPPEAPVGAAPWTLTDLGHFIVFVAGWLLASQLLTFAGYAALQPLIGWRTPATALQTNTFFALVAQMIFYVPVLGYVYHLVVIRYRLGFWAGLGWGRIRPQRSLALFLGGVLLALVSVRLPIFLPDRDTFPLQQLFSSAAAAYAVAGFAVLVAPFMEELVFRGILFAIFERQVGLRFAVAGSAALFAAFHVPEYWGAWNHLFLVAVAGCVFSLARGATGSLASSVILHLAYNSTLMTALFIDTHHFQGLSVLAP